MHAVYAALSGISRKQVPAVQKSPQIQNLVENILALLHVYFFYVDFSLCNSLIDRGCFKYICIILYINYTAICRDCLLKIER